MEYLFFGNTGLTQKFSGLAFLLFGEGNEYMLGAHVFILQAGRFDQSVVQYFIQFGRNIDLRCRPFDARLLFQFVD